MREIEPTQAEWATAIDFLTRTGQMCDDKRQEFILMSDVLGVSMLVDAINHRLVERRDTEHGRRPVPHSRRAGRRQRRQHGGRTRPGFPVSSSARCAASKGEPVAGATLDLWQTDGEGLYEAQRPEITRPWMRGLYPQRRPTAPISIRTVAPIAYTIPMDGTIGELDEPHQSQPHAPGPYPFRARARRAITAW